MANILVTINGVDKTDVVRMGSVSINDALTSKVNTATFKVFDLDGTDKPSYGDVVRIYDEDSTQVFAGLIIKTDEKRSSISPENGEEILDYGVQCQDWTRLLMRRLIIDTYQNKTCLEILTEMIDKYYPNDGITLNNVDTGITVEQITFNYKQGDKAIEALANATGYEWYIDYDKDLHFFLPTDGTATFTITDDTTNWTDLQIKPDTSQIRNRVYVRGGIYYSDPYMQSIVPDGEQEEFLLAYTPKYEDFSMTVNSIDRTVGIKNIDEAADFDFLLDRKEKALSMGETAWAIANKPLLTTDSIQVTYNYEIPILIVQENSDSIESLKTLEGGSGVYEYLITDKNISSIEAARDRARAELRDYANPVIRGTVTSYDDAKGMKSGDLIEINSTRRGINTTYAVQGVKMQQITPTRFKYTIEFSGRLYGFVDILMSLFKRSGDVLLGLDEVLDAFNLFNDQFSLADGTPSFVDSMPPYYWSNDAGTTPNKMQWSLCEWS